MSQRLTIKDFYTEYRYRHDVRDERYVDKKNYILILRTFFKLLSKAIIEEAYEYKIPHGLGFLKVVKFKAKNRAVDWKKSNEYKEKYGIYKFIYHVNNHSEGFAARFYWDKKDAIIRNKSLYTFHTTRANARYIAKMIKDKNVIKKYYEKIRKRW
jgi:hypothetical protein